MFYIISWDCYCLTVSLWCMLNLVFCSCLVLVYVWLCVRAVLEDLAHGSGPVCSAVCSHDSSQHLPGGLCLQECQVRPQAQVRIAISLLFSLSPKTLLGFFSFTHSEDCIDHLLLLSGLLRNVKMPCPKKWLASSPRPTTAKCPAKRRTRGISLNYETFWLACLLLSLLF